MPSEISSKTQLNSITKIKQYKIKVWMPKERKKQRIRFQYLKYKVRNWIKVYGT